jgi:hypothetical protein
LGFKLVADEKLRKKQAHTSKTRRGDSRNAVRGMGVTAVDVAVAAARVFQWPAERYGAAAAGGGRLEQEGGVWVWMWIDGERRNRFFTDNRYHIPSL